MVDRINYRFPQMTQAAAEIDAYAQRYEQASSALIEGVMAAIATWEGEAKEQFVRLLTGAEGVEPHTRVAIPNLVRVVAAQITMSRENMERTDQDLAANIPGGISGGG